MFETTSSQVKDWLLGLEIGTTFNINHIARDVRFIDTHAAGQALGKATKQGFLSKTKGPKGTRHLNYTLLKDPKDLRVTTKPVGKHAPKQNTTFMDTLDAVPPPPPPSPYLYDELRRAVRQELNAFLRDLMIRLMPLPTDE